MLLFQFLRLEGSDWNGNVFTFIAKNTGKILSNSKTNQNNPFLIPQSKFSPWPMPKLTGLLKLYETCVSGMVKIVVSAWVIWFINIILMESTVPEGIYQPLENITIISMMVIITGGHVLTFHAIRNNNRKIFNATHNSQQAILFKREKKAFKDMTFYTVATLLSLLPLLVLLNHVENSIVSGHILFPWAQIFSQQISSLNPVIQIQRNAALRQALKMALWMVWALSADHPDSGLSLEAQPVAGRNRSQAVGLVCSDCRVGKCLPYVMSWLKNVVKQEKKNHWLLCRIKFWISVYLA